MFILMGGSNTALICQIRAKNKLIEEAGLSSSMHLKRELCVLSTVLVFFELSYGFRYIYDLYLLEYLVVNGHIFAAVVCTDLVFVFDGLSFFFLLFYHYKNFKKQGDARMNYKAVSTADGTSHLASE